MLTLKERRSLPASVQQTNRVIIRIKAHRHKKLPQQRNAIERTRERHNYNKVNLEQIVQRHRSPCFGHCVYLHHTRLGIGIDKIMLVMIKMR